MLSSILATILATTVGFNDVVWIALAIYLLGIGALARMPTAAARRTSSKRAVA